MIYTLALDQKWRTFILNLNRDVLLSRQTQNTSNNILLCPWNISDLGPEPDPGPRNPSPLTPDPRTPEPPWPPIIVMGRGGFPSRFPCCVLSYFSLVIVVEHSRRWWLHIGGSKMLAPHFKDEIAGLQKWPFLAGFDLFCCSFCYCDLYLWENHV